ncbi:Acyl carrier protein [Noviherbaspirillum humi]|uniref:Acyl carrier protein n=1 Tax=Noviherbaspirillum humi TaxID=1688639 RepID=A0A239JNR7_9BURK|nr:acyl carrier protein [Noviherbaspirillum humi]SNT07666.1 Acyl carrier protein [Noviherbaspirillum humi]
MNQAEKQQLRAFIENALAGHGDRAGVNDRESLFASGRLDSFTMMKLVMFLEERHGIDFSDEDFDVELVDSVEAIEALVDARAMQK